MKPTVVLNPLDAAALERLVGPLPEGAVTVSEPVRIEPEQRWVVPNRRDRRAARRRQR